MGKNNALKEPLVDIEKGETADDDEVKHSSIGRILGLAGPETCLLIFGVIMMCGSVS